MFYFRVSLIEYNGTYFPVGMPGLALQHTWAYSCAGYGVAKVNGDSAW